MDRRKYNNRGGFTMIELIMVIIASSIIFSLSSVYTIKNNWYEAVNKMNTQIYNILEKGVMDNTIGYINSSGGDCSSSSEYIDISAGRVVDCIGWDNAYNYDGVKSTNGDESYITGLLSGYTDSAYGCSLYIDDKDSDKYYFFLDCSNLNYDGGSSRYKLYIEEKVASMVRDEFSTIYQDIQKESISIDTDTGGSNDDGMIRFLMKK